MELSRQSPATARYTGLGIVVAVHVVAITALSLAFVKPTPKSHEPTVLLPPLPWTENLPPPQEPPLRPPTPTFRDVFVPPVEPIPWSDAPTIPPDPVRHDGPTSVVDGPSGVGTPSVATPPVVRAQPQVQAPGAVCSVMPRPDVPVVSWTGEAVLQVMATVRGGRVVGSEFRVMQGALDSKSRRALQRSVESALSGYQCQGDAMFQQDFAFRID